MATTLTLTYQQPVNNSASVLTTSVNVNIAAVMGGDPVVGQDYQSLVNTIMLRGYWNGQIFIPAKQITLITVV